jgi:hypothetical protein
MVERARVRRETVQEFGARRSWSSFQSAVSLHAHTHHSREIMADLPKYIVRIPIVAACFARQLQTYSARTGTAVDFSKGWWHPPVSPREVFESEVAQIENQFGIQPLISITDHDSIAAPSQLQALYAERCAPVSFEWTVPFGPGFFHLGVHNLPQAHAAEWFVRLASFTAAPRGEPLGTILRDLDTRRDVLTVLNHPCWDLAGVGQQEHARSLARFVQAHRATLHAVEFNGYRSCQENERARALSNEVGLPLISGGDRHGRAPNAVLNLSAGRTFAEVVGEVREGFSHIVVMPEYRQHLVARKLATASEVLRHYPRHPAGRKHWTDRISLATDGLVRPLSFHWRDGGPFWVRSSILAFQVLTSPVVLPVIRAALENFDRATVEERIAA